MEEWRLEIGQRFKSCMEIRQSWEGAIRSEEEYIQGVSQLGREGRGLWRESGVDSNLGSTT